MGLLTKGGLRCANVLLPDGWARNITLEFGFSGEVAAVRPISCGDKFPTAPGPVLPGLPNLHSHAFQRAMAGLTECAGPNGDDFWTWRQAVYRFVSRLTPEDVEIIAAQLYVEMLKAGYTAVGEFHYLHHAPDGQPYDDPAEMSYRIVAASVRSGIALTLLPVLYAQGGFGGAATQEGQRRYVCDLASYARIVEKVTSEAGHYLTGIAPHSLRAVGPEALELAVNLAGDRPVHIHIAEQMLEVEECIKHFGSRPVEWLLTNTLVDARWCLVHATHLTHEETRSLAANGAVVGLCPTTEADLGDGIFPAHEYLVEGGYFGIGSDSHIVVDGAEELRLLEFGQRLLHRKRNLMLTSGRVSTGASLYGMAVQAGAQALGFSECGISVGARANVIVLDGSAPLLAAKSGDDIIDAFVFSGGRSLVRDVYVDGQRVVECGRHREEEAVSRDYCLVMHKLLSD
ncbi:MAG: formimidoylglutamate deiminase [Pseudomonadota bacterium]|nr:formimidoylglutamate deiminase [Pseudomonadota bacterium]